MRNLGNTCFFNSVMQCLTHTKPLVNYCLAGTHKAQCKKSQGCFLCTYTEYLKIIHQSQRTQPQMIVHKLRSIWQRYSLGRQEDAHEFLIIFMESLVNACFNMMKPPREFIYKNQNKTAVFQIIGGKSRSQVKCLGCGHCSNTYEDLATLSLEFPKRKQQQGPFTLEECIQHFCAAELLKGDNKYMCSGCKKRQEARKRFSIEQTPRTLMIHLKRFTNFGNKISEFLRYPETLSLKSYMSSTIDQEKGSNDSQIFDLYGVVVHQGGGCRSGHYFSYCKGFDGEWYDCNDDYVGRSSIDRVLKQQAYILFYQKRITKASINEEPMCKPQIKTIQKEKYNEANGPNNMIELIPSKPLVQVLEAPTLSNQSTSLSSNNLSDKEHQPVNIEKMLEKVEEVEKTIQQENKKQEVQQTNQIKGYEKKDEIIPIYTKPVPFHCLRKELHPVIQTLNAKKRKYQATIDLIKMPSHRSTLLLKRFKCNLNPEYVQPKLVNQGSTTV